MAALCRGRFSDRALKIGGALMVLFASEKPTVIVNLAAQKAVRYLLENSLGDLHPKQSCWLWQSALRLPLQRYRKPRLCIEQFGLWREPQFAISLAAAGEPSHEPLCDGTSSVQGFNKRFLAESDR